MGDRRESGKVEERRERIEKLEEIYGDSKRKREMGKEERE